MISLWNALNDTGRKTFHPHRIDRVLIHLEIQEDLAFEGRGRLVGCVLVEVCLRGCASSHGRFPFLCELSIVKGSMWDGSRSADVRMGRESFVS